MHEISDSELLQQFRNETTRHTAFNSIVKKYQHKIYYQIRRIVIDHDDANDVVQNTFIKVWKGLDTFREDSQLFTWMYRIATNESISFVKQKKSRIHISLDEMDFDLVSHLDGNPNFTGDKIQMKLQQAILTLPAKQRLVFNMKYFDNMKYEEMEKVLGTSVGALKASFHFAVKKIEKYLTGD